MPIWSARASGESSGGKLTGCTARKDSFASSQSASRPNCASTTRNTFRVSTAARPVSSMYSIDNVVQRNAEGAGDHVTSGRRGCAITRKAGGHPVAVEELEAPSVDPTRRERQDADGEQRTTLVLPGPHRGRGAQTCLQNASEDRGTER
jgi:hypothetical protein